MSNHYTGNRYVPKVLGLDESWNNENEYEGLTVVPYQGASYTSRKFVPKGVDILNKDYWLCTGNYDVQVEQYRQDTNNAITNVNIKLDSFSNTQDGKFQIMLDGYKSQINSYADGKYADINSDIEATNNNLNNTKNAINGSMTAYENSVQQSIQNYTDTVNNQITRVETILSSIDLVYEAGTSTDVHGDDITIIDGGIAQ